LNAASLRLENPFLLLLLVKRESKIGLVKGLLSSRISPSSGYLKINFFYNSLSWDIFFHSGLCCYIVLMSNAGVKRTLRRLRFISNKQDLKKELMARFLAQLQPHYQKVRNLLPLLIIAGFSFLQILRQLF